MTLADEDTNSILTDNANRAFQGNVATLEPSNASGAIWWPNLELMQVAPSGGQSWNVTCIAWFQSWPPGCVTRIATLPWSALLALSVSIELVYSSARVTSV